MVYHICRIFRFLQSGLDERHLAAVLLRGRPYGEVQPADEIKGTGL